MKPLLVFSFYLLVSTLSLFAQNKETYQFAQRDSALYLDILRPENPRDDHATVVSLFGGGFATGRRDTPGQNRSHQELLDRGFIVVCIDYRLGFKDSAKVAEYKSLFKLPKLFNYCIDIAVEDCAEAIAWLCRHAEQFDIDTSRIILTGCSAGAVTVLQLDYCRANGMPQTAILPRGWKPAAVVPYSGGVMCRKQDLFYATPPAPTMFMHGTKDKIVNYRQFGLPFSPKLYGASRLSDLFEENEYPYWFIKFPGVGHEVCQWLYGSADLFTAFVNQVLNGHITTLEATMTDTQLNPTEWSKMTIFDLYVH